MLLKTKGVPHKVFGPVVGRVTRSFNNCDTNSIMLIEEEHLLKTLSSDFLVVLTTLDVERLVDVPSVYNINSFEHLCDGDIVVVNSDGVVNTLYRINSQHNSLLITERCNSNCLMCSQPPKDKDDIAYHFNIHKKLIPLIPKDCIEIGLTGGEPTLAGEYFFDTVRLITEHLPDTEIHCLTNGRSFAWHSVVEKIAELDHHKLVLGIPLYSDNYYVHDYVVQAKEAFNQTVLGIYNLAKHNVRIEIRVVLHKQTIPRLTKLAEFIYKNMPFVEHVAFMGLEYIGYTPYNIDKLWIDPYLYKDELLEAVDYLSVHGVNVSIYNSQLCVMPEYLWQFSRKSISDWKNSFLEECNSCAKLEDCGGLFTWNIKKHSEYIKPFV